MMNIGLIGSGAIVERFIRSAQSYDGVNIQAVYSRNKQSDRIQALSSAYGIADIYDSFDLMLQDDGINFIYVASPNSLHYPYSLKALENGKNVICEKPFTSTKKEAEHLYETAKEKGLMIFEAIVNIHMPNFAIVKKLLPEIGQIRLVQCNYSQYSSRYDLFVAGETPNVFNPEYSGGALMDINIYNVHFAMGLFGRPDSCKYYPNITRGIDTSGLMVLEYPGFFASLIGAKDTESDNFALVQGEKGSIFIGNGTNGCEYVELKRDKNTRGVKYNEQYQLEELYYEVGEFKRIYEQKDFGRFRELCEYSIGVIEVIENARKAAGIQFPADK